MFKAKLIEDKAYYGYRSKLTAINFLGTTPIIVLVVILDLGPWFVAGAFVLYFFSMFLVDRYSKKMSALQGLRLVEIDANEIRIKSTKGVTTDTTDLSTVNKISLSGNYSMTMESLQEIRSEITGDYQQDYLTVEDKNGTQRLNFEMES